MTLPTAYRDCVGICLINGAGEIFVGQRCDQPANRPAAWQMPQGGVDKGEVPLQAAWREMGEEIGTNAAVLLDQTSDWLNYDLPEELIGKLWGGKYRGQRQLWFLFAFTGQAEDINIETEQPEFSAWKWSPLAQVADEIVSFKRDLYVQILDQFKDSIDSYRLEAG